jgi:hypothetical protein
MYGQGVMKTGGTTMSKRIWFGLAVLLIGLVGGFAIRAVTADGGGPAGPPHLVTVTGTASVSQAPDEAVITLGVRSEAATGGEAFQANAEKANAVLDSLAQMGVEDKDIKTVNVGLDRQVRDRGTKHETTVYVAHHEWEVTLRDLSAIGDVLDAAVNAGADEVRDIRFGLSDPAQARQDALAEAVKGSRAKADTIAEAAGSKVTGVVSVREQGSGSNELYLQRASLAMPAFGGVPTPVVPPEDIQVRVTVTAVWSLG